MKLYGPASTMEMFKEVFQNTGAFEKDKVVFVMGATGCGKSRLSIELATRFSAEIINSDKLQVYSGLDITTNKVTPAECRGVPHHLLGIVSDPDGDFTAEDFRHHAMVAMEGIISQGRIPIIAGGSNSYIYSLVHHPAFRSRFDCCFIWVHVSLPDLFAFVSRRVDKMVSAGLVEEVRELFRTDADYSRGVRRAIGVPELDLYFRSEGLVDDQTRTKLLEDGIKEIKENNCRLAQKQWDKICRLNEEWGSKIHPLDATEVFQLSGKAAEEAWERLVLRPSAAIVERFLLDKSGQMEHPRIMAAPASTTVTLG